MKKIINNDEQMNLFGLPESPENEGIPTFDLSAPLKVVHATFTSAEKHDWADLFSGYDELYAVTFSSSIDFVNKVIKKFRHATIIYGCEGVMSSDTAAVIAMQATAVKEIVKHKTAVSMAKRMEDGSLELYVSRDTKSHEKIFILKGEGKARVITGSANMSASAFCGLQRENIVCFDDQDAYDYYKTLFDDFLSACSDNVSLDVVNALVADENYLDENITEVPIVKTVDSKKMVFLEEREDSGEAEIVASVKGLEAELKPMLPKMKRDSGKVLITGEVTRALKRKYAEHRDMQKAKVKKLPKLHIDYETEVLDFNGKQINLTPTSEQIKSDITCIDNYFSGFSSFNGNIKQNKKEYFSFMNWFFASVFMPHMRIIASKNNFDVTPFPVVGIIYGDSNGGKSTFTKLLTKLMCGHRVPLNSSGDFTSTGIEDLKRGREGLPIVIDDLAKAQFHTHNEKVIKDDEWGLAEHFENYPAVVITTNKLPSISPDISKRAITCHIDAKISKEAGAKNSKRINESMKAASTAFFGEYVCRMLAELEIMADSMKIEEDYFPDIFKVSSDVICSIVEENIGELPPYMSRLEYSDYFGDKAVSRSAIEKLLRAWENEKKQFTVDRKNNKLIYSCPENGRAYELKYIYEELPPLLNAQLNATNIVMDLDQAEQLFETKFKKGIIRR